MGRHCAFQVVVRTVVMAKCSPGKAFDRKKPIFWVLRRVHRVEGFLTVQAVWISCSKMKDPKSRTLC